MSQFSRPNVQKLFALGRGETIDFEGAKLKASGAPLEDGVTYYAARNTEGLFTAKKVDLEKGWVVPVEDGYLFDLHECIPVIILD